VSTQPAAALQQGILCEFQQAKVVKKVNNLTLEL
jgi:hypothetical protein